MNRIRASIEFWGSNGIDRVQIKTNASRGCLVGLVKLSRQKPKDNANTVNTGAGEYAMSVAQADAVLAKYGYVDADLVAA